MNDPDFDTRDTIPAPAFDPREADGSICDNASEGEVDDESDAVADHDMSGPECWLCHGLGAEVAVPASWYGPAEYATCAACGGTGRN